MRRKLLDLCACPSCLGNLELNDKHSDEHDIIDGSLYCPNCQLKFLIREGIAVFGLRLDDKEERIQEIRAENEWTYSVNDIQAHARFAENSSIEGIKLIENIESFDDEYLKRTNVLDIGSGWGCFQAWQFAKKNYDVIAIDLCPEFIFASDEVAEDCHFERMVADCTVLPFKDNSFDIIFCKETLHHIEEPTKLLDEMWRVCFTNGLIIIKEPCTSPFLQLFIANINKAKKIGISHYFSTCERYINLMKTITKNSIVYRESFMDGCLFRSMPFFKNSFNNLIMSILGSNLVILGIKDLNYKPGFLAKRDVIPIRLNQMGFEKIIFYRDILIPAVFDYYR